MEQTDDAAQAIDLRAAERRMEAECQALRDEADRFRSLYIASDIDAAIRDADRHPGGGFFNHDQMMTLLRPMARTDDAGRVVLDFDDIDPETGEPIKTLRTPADAVRRMRELPHHYGNRFRANVKPHLGPTTDAARAVAHMSQEAFRRVRRENPESLGLPGRSAT